jgi:hypothetical protein
MTENEIKDLVKKELAIFLKEQKLTENDVIFHKNQPLLKEETTKFDYITLYKKTKNYIIMLGKKLSTIVAIFVFILNIPGKYSSFRFYSELLFQKSLPDEISIARNFNKVISESLNSLNENETQKDMINLKEEEKFLVISSEWENLNNSDYKKLAHSYLSGTRSVDDLYNQKFIFIPSSSGVINTSVANYSSTAEDFDINFA